MNQTAIIVFFVLTGLAAFQTVVTVLFVRLFHREPPRVDDTSLPRAAVFLSLRGADPQLADGLRCLMCQDYPRYELHIVVDSEKDPAWKVVERIIGEVGATNVRVSPLRQRLETCGLKNSALVQLAADLDDGFEVVVLADGDTITHADWLRELIAPMADERVGATFGNRWFVPEAGHWGSLVRYLWNAAAVVPMHFFSIPWGGSFAMRASVLRRLNLVEKWAHSIVDDAPVRRPLERLGLRTVFVPSLMLVNREECGLPFALRFIRRQLTWTRLYHPGWTPVVLHAVATTEMLFFAMGLAASELAFGQWIDAAWAGGGLALYLLAMVGLLAMLEAGVRRVVRTPGRRTTRWSLGLAIRLLPAILLTQCVQMLAVVQATFVRQVVWRGVTYRIGGPWEIRRVDDRPFEQSSAPANSNVSL